VRHEDGHAAVPPGLACPAGVPLEQLVLAVSLALPLAAATTTSAAVGLVVLHLAVGAVVIPGLASTARRAGQ
jgi:hypothetical protein